MGRSTAGRAAWLAFVLSAALVTVAPAQALASTHARHHARHHRRHHHFRAHRRGELDCNGMSRVQRSIRLSMACTDIHGIRGVSNDWVWNGRFFDGNLYIGHDEPDLTFLSGASGSGNNVTWTETLPTDPTALPTTSSPGSDITHWFELSIAPWFSMDICDSNSYPELPCTPNSDSNKPTATFPGSGAAFMEMQFYPPGFAPFADGVSCDNSHWCAALNIDSLECTLGFVTCNPNCVEPVNFAFLQTNGVPAGPPSPQQTNLATFTPNSHTLLMNPGDRIQVHLFDAEVPGSPGARAFEAVVKDLTTGQTGFMQASAKNGFQNTSIVGCSGTPHNFEPEYNTASQGNIAPWTALQTDISTQYEIGHFEPCSTVTDPVKNSLFGTAKDTTWQHCQGAYEQSTRRDGPDQAENLDAFCYPAGDTHGSLNAAPDEVTGCIDTVTQNGDLDFDGTPYWADWPTATTPTKFPGSFVQAQPVSRTTGYSQFFIQTDVALSESTCTASGAGCSVPPPNAPGAFYPFWSLVKGTGTCVIEFGNVTSGANTLGGDAQYGTDQQPTLGYPEFEGPVMPNNCTA